MEHRMSRSLILGLAGLLCSLTACGTVKVPMQVVHPAEVNLNKYKRIAFGDFQGNWGDRLVTAMKEKISASGRFELLERSRLQHVMHELKLSQSDLADEAHRVKLGKLLTATALLMGNIRDNYREEMTQTRGTCVSSYEGKRPCTNYSRMGTLNMAASIDIVDVETGRIMKSKQFKSSNTGQTSATDSGPPEIDKAAIMEAAVANLANQFQKVIVPWTEIVEVEFKKAKGTRNGVRNGFVCRNCAHSIPTPTV